MPPLMGAGLEDPRFGQCEIRIVLEEISKEGQLDFFSIILPGLRREMDVAEAFTGSSSPFPMRPVSHHEEIGNPRILFLDRLIRLQRPEQIFGVVPTPNGHDGAANMLEMRSNIS